MSRPTSSGLKRRTSSAAGHRRPFWAKNHKSFKLYMDNPRGQAHSPKAVDYGVDNFSYDEDYCKQFAMPDGFADRLPDSLREKAEDWQKAGAALCTALDRTQESYKGAIHSAYPDKTRSPRPARNDRQQASSGADISPIDSPVSPTPISAATVAKLEALSLTMSSPPTVSTTPVGMESPPYTPFDTKACATPVGMPPQSSKNMNALPSLVTSNSELTPLSSFSSAASSQSPTTMTSPGFDDISWEYFLKKYEEEIKDNKLALSRVKGYAKSIDILLIELGTSMKPEVKLPVMHFSEWWSSMKPKVRALEERVKGLDSPKLEYVTIEYEMAKAQEMGIAHSGVLESPHA